MTAKNISFHPSQRSLEVYFREKKVRIDLVTGARTIRNNLRTQWLCPEYDESRVATRFTARLKEIFALCDDRKQVIDYFYNCLAVFLCQPEDMKYELVFYTDDPVDSEALQVRNILIKCDPIFKKIKISNMCDTKNAQVSETNTLLIPFDNYQVHKDKHKPLCEYDKISIQELGRIKQKIAHTVSQMIRNKSLTIPDEVIKTREVYFNTRDSIKSFVKDKCIVTDDMGDMIRGYHAYIEFLNHTKRVDITYKMFRKEMENYCTIKNRWSYIYFAGLILNPCHT